MGTKVQIMDMELDLFTQETFHDEIASYLANDVLNVVHMISLDYIDMYDENELVQEVMKEADMVLPGEKTILSAHHVEVLETGNSVLRQVQLRLPVLPESGRLFSFSVSYPFTSFLGIIITHKL